jgi:hypothetical protein
MRRHYIILLLSVTLSFILGCAALNVGDSRLKRHEENIKGNSNCLECHEKGDPAGNKPFSIYVHNASFFDRHGDVAGGFQAICESCHKPKYCADCHGVKEEIAPSRKLGNRPDRSSPHRGDYFAKHKIEGRLNQAKCFQCHGRRNNKTCGRCHNP